MPDPHQLLRLTLESVRDAIVTTDAVGRVQIINTSAQEMTGWSQSEAHGRPVEEVVNLREYGSDNAKPNPAYTALRNDEKVTNASPSLLVGRDGRRLGVHVSATPLDDRSGGTEGCLLILHDASDALRLAERMAYMAQHDPLTGLPNRILLVDRLEQGTRLSDRNSEPLAVIFVDLDHFHQINEVYGHASADQLLKEVSYRLADALRESDTVCRLGGDEFVLLLLGVKSHADIESLAAKVLSEVARPFPIGEHTVQTTCSIGVSVYPQNATDAGTLMRLADGAMHKAKQSGRNCSVFATRQAEQLSIGDEKETAEASSD
jgi:diguanylate cyclase (GGDEF)-like protein/PAS domain S-box-containing protein